MLDENRRGKTKFLTDDRTRLWIVERNITGGKWGKKYLSKDRETDLICRGKPRPRGTADEISREVIESQNARRVRDPSAGKTDVNERMDEAEVDRLAKNESRERRT